MNSTTTSSRFRRSRSALLYPLLALATLFLVWGNSATAADKVFKWKLQSFAGPTTNEFLVVKNAMEHLKKATNGRLDVTVYGPKTFVGFREMLEALGKRVYEVGQNATGFFSNLDPAYSVFFSLPGVWTEPRQVKIWFYHFGGEELLREAHAKHNVHLVAPLLAHAEGLFSRKPINTLADFKGLTVRTPPGLTSGIFTKLGAKPVPMGGGEIYTALDTGVVDAAEFISLESNYKMGLHKVTKYLLWPSFHSPTTLDDLSVNMDAWKELPPDLQAAFELAAGRVARDFDYEVSAGDYGALEKIKASGVKHVTLSQADISAVRKLGLEQLDEWAGKSELAGRVVASIKAYLKQTGGGH